jgi:hypothetical protein
MGAAAGCAVGHHEAKKQAPNAKQAPANGQPAPTNQGGAQQ